MSQPSFQPQTTAGFAPATQESNLLRDILWGRPVFRAPTLPNPRVIFDPPPFRTQLFSTVRRAYRLARR